MRRIEPLPPPPPPVDGPIAAPSALQLEWYERDRGAMITWNLLSHCLPEGDPDASDLACKHSPGMSIMSAAALQKYYPRDYNATALVEAAGMTLE